MSATLSPKQLATMLNDATAQFLEAAESEDFAKLEDFVMGLANQFRDVGWITQLEASEMYLAEIARHSGKYDPFDDFNWVGSRHHY